MRHFVIIVFILTLFSCKEEEKVSPISLDPNSRQIIVLNEGNFRSANASLSLYYPENGTVEHDIFRSNNNRPLGDVVQSITKIGSYAYIVVNNSSKIEVVNANTFESVATISGFNSPRYILPIGPTKAYVSDLYEDKIYIINPTTFSISGTINSHGWTEEMVLVDNKAFVCQMDSSEILVIDTQSDSILKRIPTNVSPSSIGLDENSNVWVACTGGIQNDFPAIHKLNPFTLNIEATMEWMDNSKSINHLSFASNGRDIYYLMDGLHHMQLGDSSLSSTPLIPENGRNFYGMGIDPFNGDIYLSDAIDYQQKGVVYRYDKNGEELVNFKAGLIPANFYFN